MKVRDSSYLTARRVVLYRLAATSVAVVATLAVGGFGAAAASATLTAGASAAGGIDAGGGSGTGAGADAGTLTTDPAEGESNGPPGGGPAGSPPADPNGGDPEGRGGDRSAFNRPGMWIWYLSQSHGGNYQRIIRQARQSGIGTLYIKSADGRNVWSQFTRPMVRRFQRAGLKVCGWHYVYGDHPVEEARASAAAARRGADCFVIDAEAEYRGKYAAADRYMRVLRRLVGARYPLALTSFPYVDYHPSFPYSVFLGIGGAQVNKPQMYWKTIGTTVSYVFHHTYRHNRLFRRPIRPLGQTYLSPTPRELIAFRRLTTSYAGVPSWWSWQETEGRGWRSLGARAAGRVSGHRVMREHATLRRGSRGDMVVWAQQHLKSAVAPNLPVTGNFVAMTERAVRNFQRSRGLPVDGVLGTATWRRLLQVRPVRTSWWVPPRQVRRMAARDAARPGGASASSAAALAQAAAGRGLERAPASASLPSKAFELGPPRREPAESPGLR